MGLDFSSIFFQVTKLVHLSACYTLVLVWWYGSAVSLSLLLAQVSEHSRAKSGGGLS
jgi:hypothetical protein